MSGSRVRRLIDNPEISPSLSNGHSPKTAEEKRDAERAELAAKLDARRFVYSKPPPKPIPLYTINGQNIGTRGNLQAIQAQSKAGKTAFLGAMFAAWMRPGIEYLGVTCCDDPQGALLHFDSEQSPYDHWDVIDRSRRRAVLIEPPPLLRSYYVTDLSLTERKASVLLELERAKAEHGAIFGVFIDGLGDWALSLNDEQEAFALVAEMHTLAVKFDTSIYCVLHENEGSDNAKMRGHLGSQLARKAETPLRLQKGDDGETVVFSEKARHCYITKADGPRFKWDDEEKMHVPTASKCENKSSAKQEALSAVAAECFRDAAGIGLTWQQLHEEIIRITKLSEKTAERRIGEFMEAKIVYKKGDRYYRK